MLISRDALDYVFQGPGFDLKSENDRHFLGWVMDQFLYGEVTGIQCGHWLYHAPTLHAASFLARQAAEELSHVKRILKIQSLLGVSSNPAHPAVRFLSTGMMGGTWGEHVALEMALGEGLVLSVFYALARLIPHPEIRALIESAIVDEEKHVAFGERETNLWLKRFPEDRKLFLSQALLQILALKKLKRFIFKKLPENHPVLEQFPAFYDFVVARFEERVMKLGLIDRSIAEIGFFEKMGLLVSLPIRARIARWTRPKKLLTSTYLDDPWVSKRLDTDDDGGAFSR